MPGNIPRSARLEEQHICCRDWAQALPGCLSHPPFSQPPPMPYPVKEGQGAGGTQLSPVPAEKCWLDAFPRVPRLPGVWLAFRLEPTLAGPLPRGFVTWRSRWCSGREPGFLGSVVGCGPNASCPMSGWDSCHLAAQGPILRGQASGFSR